jgi:hypothetical protein
MAQVGWFKQSASKLGPVINFGVLDAKGRAVGIAAWR